MRNHFGPFPAGIALLVALGAATVSVASADQSEAFVTPPNINLYDVSRPYVPNLRIDEIDLPTIVGAFKPNASSVSATKQKSTPAWWQKQPIPCNTQGLYTVQQQQNALQACSDRFFNVDHSP